MAFNLSSLYLWKQLSHKVGKVPNCCEWLSIWVLCIFENSWKFWQHLQWCVVNGFQFEFFVSLKTAAREKWLRSLTLWMAFNLSSLYLWKQQSNGSTRERPSCEWLSIWVLCIFENSQCIGSQWRTDVVNGFQFEFFVSLKTAFGLSFVYRSCCEWLSIWVLCIFENSRSAKKSNNQTVVNGFQFEFFVSLKTASKPRTHLVPLVVNGFQFEFFVSLKTANIIVNIKVNSLWMAFNLSSLYLWKQLFGVP